MQAVRPEARKKPNPQPVCLTAPTRQPEPRWGLAAGGRLLPGDWPSRAEALAAASRRAER